MFTVWVPLMPVCSRVCVVALLLMNVMWLVLCDSVLSFSVLAFVNRLSMCVLLSVTLRSPRTRPNTVLCMWLAAGCRRLVGLFVFMLVSSSLCNSLFMTCTVVLSLSNLWVKSVWR